MQNKSQLICGAIFSPSIAKRTSQFRLFCKTPCENWLHALWISYKFMSLRERERNEKKREMCKSYSINYAKSGGNWITSINSLINYYFTLMSKTLMNRGKHDHKNCQSKRTICALCMSTSVRSFILSFISATVNMCVCAPFSSYAWTMRKYVCYVWKKCMEASNCKRPISFQNNTNNFFGFNNEITWRPVFYLVSIARSLTFQS